MTLCQARIENQPLRLACRKLVRPVIGRRFRRRMAFFQGWTERTIFLQSHAGSPAAVILLKQIQSTPPFRGKLIRHSRTVKCWSVLTCNDSLTRETWTLSRSLAHKKLNFKPSLRFCDEPHNVPRAFPRGTMHFLALYYALNLACTYRTLQCDI